MRHTPGLTMFDGATHPTLRAPLSERGWRSSDLLIIKTMRQPIPSRRGVPQSGGVCRTSHSDSEAVNKNEVRGVSHYEPKHIPDAYQHPNFHPKNEHSLPASYKTSFGRCPFVVRLLSDCCPFINRTTNGQRADNNRTTTEVDTAQKRHFCRALPSLWQI